MNEHEEFLAAQAEFENQSSLVLEWAHPAIHVYIGMAIDEYRRGATTETAAMERIRREIDKHTAGALANYMRDWREKRRGAA